MSQFDNIRRRCYKDDGPRFVARSSVLQHNVNRQSLAGPDKTATWMKSNIYEFKKTGNKGRFRIEPSIYLGAVDRDDVGFWPQFSCYDNEENAPCVVDCWIMHSKFIIYFVEDHNSKTFKHRFTTLESRSATFMPYSMRVDTNFIDEAVLNAHLTHSEIRFGYRVLVLSWFDRLDRMIFSKFLSRVNYYDSHFKLTFPVELLITVCEFL
jgi:hypothetical protein